MFVRVRREVPCEHFGGVGLGHALTSSSASQGERLGRKHKSVLQVGQAARRLGPLEVIVGITSEAQRTQVRCAILTLELPAPFLSSPAREDILFARQKLF